MIWPAPEAPVLELCNGALDLPVRATAAAAEWQFPESEAAPALQTCEIRPEGHVRRSEIDQRSGRVRLIVEDDFSEYENLDHGGCNCRT